MQQEHVEEGAGDLEDPRRPSGGRSEWRRGPDDHGRVTVQSLKRRACLLCDYAGIKDPGRETMDMLEAGKVLKRVAGLVTPATVVMVGNVVEAFLAMNRLNLVSPFFLMAFFHSVSSILFVLFL